VFGSASGDVKLALPDLRSPRSHGEDLRYSSVLMILGSPMVPPTVACEEMSEVLIKRMELDVMPSKLTTRKMPSQPKIHIFSRKFSANRCFINT
jgi:hypothetical protein